MERIEVLKRMNMLKNEHIWMLNKDIEKVQNEVVVRSSPVSFVSTTSYVERT